MLEINQVYNVNCLDSEGMKAIPDKSIDFILCDLPYGITRNHWDSVIPLEELWEQYSRIIKDNGAIALTASQPFTSILAASNLKMFRYEWIWKKNKSTGFLNAKKMPLKQHESVLIFYKKLPIYNPQKTTGHKPVNSFKKNTSDGTNYGKTQTGIVGGGQTDRYPTSIIEFPVVNNDSDERIHPNQKPLGLLEFLIKTYTNENDLVLDNCMGSGATAIACINTNRNFIGFELEKDYYLKATKRIEKALNEKREL
ncbi:DNA-methyltransferase [Priestia megaterium]|uniref:DNA-methyltransferase n=1 Tax=Priestia megaterium TaxID=1404 RepID=UPI0035DAB21B